MKKIIYIFLFLIAFNINAFSENCFSKLKYVIYFSDYGANQEEEIMFQFENSSDQNILINYLGVLNKNKQIILESKTNEVINSYSKGYAYLKTQGKLNKYFDKYVFNCEFTKRTKGKSSSGSFSFKTILGKLMGVKVF